MFPLSPNSCQNEKDNLSIIFFFHARVLFQVWSLLFICLWEREMGDSEDSEERMCFCNDTKLTALKLKSLIRVWEAAKEVPARCLTPVLAAGAREQLPDWDSRAPSWGWADLGSAATSQAPKDLDQNLPPHMHTHTQSFVGFTGTNLALASSFPQSCHEEVPKDTSVTAGWEKTAEFCC